MPRQKKAPEISSREKWGLGAGYVASQGPHNVVHILSHQVLNVTMGMNPMLINALLFVQRMWGALLDPILGQWSDNLRTPFGRRRPLLFAAAFPLAGGFTALWLFPRHTGATGLFLSLLGCSLVLYGGISLYSVALGGLQIEVTTEYHQRTRLAAFLQLCFLAFALASQWIYPAVSLLPDPIAGVRFMGVVLGAAFLALALLPVLLVREQRYDGVARGQRRLRLRESFGAALRNGPFLRMLLAAGAANFGYYLAAFLGVYLNYYYIYGGRVQPASVMQGWLGTAFQIAALGAIVVFRRISTVWGKKTAFSIAAGVHIASSLAKLVCYQPAHPALQLVVYVLNGAAFAGISLLSLSMLADVADLDEWRTGHRTEGITCSVFNWADKIGGAMGILLCGFVFPAIGFDTARGAAQSESTLRWMLLLYAAFPFVGGAVALAIIQPYSLTERTVAALQSRIERRRRNSQSAPGAGRALNPVAPH